MNREIGERWVAALRGGEYEQYTTGGLKSPVCDKRMCCLGVLANLYAKEHGVKWEANYEKPCILGESDYLPVEVQEWAKIDKAADVLDFRPGYAGDNTDLAELNDDKVPFSTLADLIEEQLIPSEAAL